MEKILSLQRMPRERLSSILLSPEAPNLAIIDVRGDDHVGGHIHTSTHVPSQSLDYRIPQLVRTLANKEIVVIHCALSQERGPRAARRYMEARNDTLKKEKRVKKGSGENDRGERMATSEGEDGSGAGAGGSRENIREQEVYVLDGGFVKWQEKYGKDERLTEAYAADLWEDYY